MSITTEDFFANSYLVSFNTSLWTGRRTATNIVTDTVDPSAAYMGIRLVNPHHLNGIINEKMKFERTTLAKYAAPFKFRSVWRVHKDVKPTINEEWEKYVANFNALVQEFANNLDKYREEWRPKLNNEYDPNDYPSDVTKYFSTTLTEFIVDAPSISSDVEVQEKKQSVIQLLEESKQLAVTTFRQQIKEIVGGLSEQLKNGKRFQQRSIDKPLEWCKRFNEFLNLDNDTVLQEELENLKKKLKNVDIQDVRDNDTYRIKLADSMKEVSDNINSLLVDDTGRSFTL